MRALFATAAVGLSLLAGCGRSVLVKLTEPKLKAAYQETSDIFAEAGWACEDEKWNDGSKWLRCKSGKEILLLGFDMIEGRASLTIVSPWQQPNCKQANFRHVVDKFNRDMPLASCECVSGDVLLIWTAIFLPEDGLPRTELPQLAQRWHKVALFEANKAHLLDDGPTSGGGGPSGGGGDAD